jgi:polyhydroxybutyrate depolymerase
MTSRTAFAFPIAVAAILTAFATSSALGNETATRKFSFRGMEREYILSLPPKSGPQPTLLILHGGGMNARSAARTTGMETLIAREGLVAVYPNAYRREWNDGREARLAARGYSDDVGYLRALVAALVKEGIADPKRIYVTGASNGGMMSLRLICEAADVFAAAAPIIASLPADIAKHCKPARAVPVLVINGTADPLVPYGGGGVGFAGRRGNVLSTDATMARLRRFNGCTDEARTERLFDFDPADGSTVTVNSWTSCASGAPVVLYRVDGGGHRIPQRQKRNFQVIDRMLGRENHDFDAAEVIWAFFRDKTL